MPSRAEPSPIAKAIPLGVAFFCGTKKARGLHTANPFECTQFTVADIEGYRVDEADLKARTLDAVRQGAKHPSMKKAMDTLAVKAYELAEATRDAVYAANIEPPTEDEPKAVYTGSLFRDG